MITQSEFSSETLHCEFVNLNRLNVKVILYIYTHPGYILQIYKTVKEYMKHFKVKEEKKRCPTIRTLHYPFIHYIV